MVFIDSKSRVFYLFFAAIFLSEVTLAVEVSDIRTWRAPDHTRLVFDLSGPVEHKLFMLRSPDRLVLDIERSSFEGSLSGLELAKTPIKNIRTALRNKNDLRVVLDLSSGIKPRSFVLKKQQGKNDRLVVDLYDQAASAKTVKTVASATSSGQLYEPCFEQSKLPSITLLSPKEHFITSYEIYFATDLKFATEAAFFAFS